MSLETKIAKSTAPFQEVPSADLVDQDNKLKKQREKTTNNLLNFLITEGVLTPNLDSGNRDKDAEDVYTYNPTKLEDKEFKKMMHYKSLGCEGTTSRTVSRSLIFSRLGNLKVVVKGEEERGLMALKESIDIDRAIQQKTIAYLKSQGVIAEDKGLLVVDFDKLFDPDYNERRMNRKGIKAGLYGGSRKMVLTYKNLREMLGSFKIVSKDDYDRAKKDGREPEPKFLVNNYESIDDAFDPVAQKDNNGYVDPWDFHSKADKAYTFWDYKIKTKDGEEINPKELYFFKKVFVDGKAERRGDDLVVFNKLTNEFEKINVDWFEEHMPLLKKWVSGSIHSFLLDNCPNLREKGLIRLDDFKIKSGGPSSSLIRPEKTILGRTAITLDQVQYAVGRSGFPYIDENIPRENIKVVKLDSDDAGIVVSFEGKERLVATFPLLTEEEKEAKRKVLREEDAKKGKTGVKPKDLTARTTVSVNELLPRVKKWGRRIDNPRLEGETEADYAKRIEEVGDYGDVSRVTKKFTEKCKVGIHNLTWREQQWLVHMNYQLLGQDNNRLVEFGERYGLEGLKTFLSCELDKDMAYKILDIGERLDPETAKAIFKKYSEIINSTRDMETGLQDVFKEERDVNPQIRMIVEDLLKRGGSLLTSFASKIKTGKTDGRELLEDLEKYKTDSLKTAGLFKVLSKGGLKPEDLRGVSFFTKSSSELADEEKKKIIEMARANYGTNQLQQEDVVAGIERAFQNGEQTRWHILTKKTDKSEELFSVIRFDDLADGSTRAATFNVDPVLRGSSLGEATFHKAVDEEARTRRISSIVEVGKDVGEFYVNKGGFRIVGIDNNSKTKIDYYLIVRDDDENEFSSAKGERISDRELLENYCNEDKPSDIFLPINLNKFIFAVRIEDREQPMSKVAAAVEKGYSVTRIINNEKDGKKYFVFEKIPASAKRELSEAA